MEQGLFKRFIGEKFTFNGFYRYAGSNQPRYIDSSLFSQEVIASVGRATNPGAEILNVNHWEGSFCMMRINTFHFYWEKGGIFGEMVIVPCSCRIMLRISIFKN